MASDQLENGVIDFLTFLDITAVLARTITLDSLNFLSNLLLLTPTLHDLIPY